MYAREKLGARNSWYRLMNILYTVTVGMCVCVSMTRSGSMCLREFWTECCAALRTLHSNVAHIHLRSDGGGHDELRE